MNIVQSLVTPQIYKSVLGLWQQTMENLQAHQADQYKKNNSQYGRYFYLSDLLVEKEYRKKGYGEKLLKLLENKMQLSGVEYFWTWTAGYEAASLYLKQGYKIFTRFEKFYLSGHARVGLIKKIQSIYDVLFNKGNHDYRYYPEVVNEVNEVLGKFLDKYVRV